MKYKENRAITGELLGYWDESGFAALITAPFELDDEGNVTDVLKIGNEIIPMGQDEIDANKKLVAEIEANEIAMQYKRDRAKAYPSIADQLDTLYHEGYDGWKATVQALWLPYAPDLWH
jgi:hypothetical protein